MTHDKGQSEALSTAASCAEVAPRDPKKIGQALALGASVTIGSAAIAAAVLFARKTG